MEGDYVHLGQFEVSVSYLRKDVLQAVGFLSLQGERKPCSVDTGLGTVGVWMPTRIRETGWLQSEEWMGWGWDSGMFTSTSVLEQRE